MISRMTKTKVAKEALPGRESPFTAEQRAYIRSFYNKWNNLMLQHDPTSSLDFKGPLKVWRDETADEIMRSDLFDGQLDTTVMKLGHWETVCLTVKM